MWRFVRSPPRYVGDYDLWRSKLIGFEALLIPVRAVIFGAKKGNCMNILAAGILGGWELVLILAVVLILFGAKKLPELAKGLGQGIKEFKKASREVQEEFNHAAEAEPEPPRKTTYSEAKSLPQASPPEPEHASTVPQSSKEPHV